MCLQNCCFLQTFSLASLGQCDPSFPSSVAVSLSVFPQIHIIFQGFTICICPLAGSQSCRAPYDLGYYFHAGGACGPCPPAPVPKPCLCTVCPSAPKMQPPPALWQPGPGTGRLACPPVPPPIPPPHPLPEAWSSQHPVLYLCHCHCPSGILVKDFQKHPWHTLLCPPTYLWGVSICILALVPHAHGQGREGERPTRWDGLRAGGLFPCGRAGQACGI